MNPENLGNISDLEGWDLTLVAYKKSAACCTLLWSNCKHVELLKRAHVYKQLTVICPNYSFFTTNHLPAGTIFGIFPLDQWFQTTTEVDTWGNLISGYPIFIGALWSKKCQKSGVSGKRQKKPVSHVFGSKASLLNT